MSNGARRAVVVGGGVIGAACAYYLAKAGWKVTVLDRGEFGKGCSHGNCGFISPSHVLPLAAPGAVRDALSAMLHSNSPFSIKPRFDLTLWGWLLRFAWRCSTRQMLQGGKAIQALLNSSRSLYGELVQSELFDCEWETRGAILVFHSQPAMEHHGEKDHLLRESFNMPATRYDGDALLAVEPALKPGLAGGWHYLTDAHLRPDRLMASWRRVLQTQGVELREMCEMIGIAGDTDRARAVRTNQGDVPGEAIVISAGAWTPLLSSVLGSKIPIQPGKGYSITMPRPRICPAIPLLFEEHRVGVTPMQSGYRLGSTMEFAGYDTSLNPRRLALLKEGASHYLHEPYAEPVLEQWYGWRPMTPDSVPIIDRSRSHANVMIAAGHNMLGVSMAPATGKLVAELLSGAPCHIDPVPYALSRF